jgi:hypothetical protein
MHGINILERMNCYYSISVGYRMISYRLVMGLFNARVQSNSAILTVESASANLSANSFQAGAMAVQCPQYGEKLSVILSAANWNTVSLQFDKPSSLSGELYKVCGV